MIDFAPIWISLKTATVATAIAFCCGLAIARWMLDYRGKFSGAIEGLLTAPLVLPPTVVGFLLLLLLGRNGFIGQILAYGGVSLVFSWSANVIAATVVAFPLMYKTALGAFRQIDPDLIACARTLGTTEKRIFWQIIVPLARPGLIAGTLLTFARALGEFGATLMLAGSIPGKTETIPIAIFLAASSGAMDRALILVIVMLVMAIAVMTCVDSWSKTKLGSQQWRRHQRQLTQQLRGLVPYRPSNIAIATETQDNLELIVKLYKRLPDFELDVCFTADRSTLGLLGVSGAGKSLILRCIAGLETPDRGQIILNGRVLYDSQQNINLPPRERGCGFLFQNYALFPHLTVAENIAFAQPNWSSHQRQTEITRQLGALNLDDLGDRYPRELSGGQQQRVALARAEVSRAKLLLLDEPFSALDTDLRDSLSELLRHNLLHYPGIALFVTHNREEAYRVCQRLLVVDQGKAIARGTTNSIFAQPPNPIVARLTGVKNFSRAIAVNQTQIKAIDWDCILQVSRPIPQSLSHVGIYAHQLVLNQTPTADNEHINVNTFSCWLVTTSAAPSYTTCYLKLGSPPQSPQDYHLQVELFKPEAQKLLLRPLPWQLTLDPAQIIIFHE